MTRKRSIRIKHAVFAVRIPQVAKSSDYFSTLSANESTGPPSLMVALYRGLKVAVYTVDKPEISLTRQDLVELVNVCSISFLYPLSRVDCTGYYASAQPS